MDQNDKHIEMRIDCSARCDFQFISTNTPNPVYVLSSLYLIQSMSYPVSALSSLCLIQSLPYPVYVLSSLCLIQSMSYPVYVLSSLCLIQSMPLGSLTHKSLSVLLFWYYFSRRTFCFSAFDRIWITYKARNLQPSNV